MELYDSSKNTKTLENRALKDKIKVFENFKQQQERKKDEPIDPKRQLIELMLNSIIDVKEEEKPSEEEIKKENDKLVHKIHKKFDKMFGEAKTWGCNDISDFVCVNKNEYEILQSFRSSIEAKSNKVTKRYSTLKRNFLK